MIITNLHGGLGNQLFQYAAGLALAVRHGTNLKVDSGRFSRFGQWGFVLDRLRMPLEHATQGEVRRYAGFTHSRLSRALFHLRRRFQPAWPRTYCRQTQGGQLGFLTGAGADSYLDGYWQDERYFTAIRGRLLQETECVRDPSPERRGLLALAANPGSASIHVRRGDYAAVAATHARHGCLGAAYYGAAIERLSEASPGGARLVFSDDIDWARRELGPMLPGAEFVTGDISAAEEDLRLMRLCTHHVIANSTFSWWGAWLGERPGSLIVAPRVWFARPEPADDDPVPPRWTRL